MSHTSIPKDQRRRRALLHSPTLIGRDRELTLLRDAMCHPPGLVLVEGEAGIGKSRLVREAVFRSAVKDRRVLLGHCHRLRDPFPLGPVVEALRGAGDQPPIVSMSPVVGALGPLLPELAGILPPEPAPVGEPRAERHRVFRALRELIGAFGPTVCVLEDLHWADEGTLELLTFLLSEPPSQLVLILTHRSEDLPASSPLRGLASRLSEATHRTTVELSPLSVEEVRRLMSAMLEGQAVPEELASDLHERTAGIPFAVEEVVRLLHEQDQLRVGKRGPGQQTRQVGVPPAISQSIRERMGALDRDARLITQSAAVLAVWVDEDLLRRVAGLPPLRATRALTQSLSHGLLEEKRDGRYSFRHMLAAEAVYAEIPAPERRRLHLRAGRALERGSEPRPLAQLAHHFKEADRPLLWTGYAEAAAEAATSIGNDREAAMLLEEALRAPRLSRAARIRMAIKLGAAALYSVSPRSAIEVLQPISDQEQMPPGVRGELRFSLARLRSHAGDRRWREEMVEAVSELGRRPELAARAMLTLAWPSMGEGKLDDDLCWLDRAVEAAGRTDDQVVRRVVSAQRAAILLSVGDPAGWRALRETPARAASIEEKVAQLRSCHNLSMVTLGLGHYRHAEHFLAQAARLDDELEHVSWGPGARARG